MPNLEPIPAFEDNYIWAAHDGRTALLVDPGEAEPILTWLDGRGIRPNAVLVTHHHGDHCGGLPELLDRHPGLAVFGPAGIRGVNRPVGDGDTCPIPGLEMEFRVLAVPGHTRDHLAYHGHGWLFCGDTLFSCGCGKAFECPAGTLYASLERLARLPPETWVCCAHEYTLDNIRFALSVDPDNSYLLRRHDEAAAQRHSGLPTLPTRLADELACNPFLRCDTAQIRDQAIRSGDVDASSNTAAVFTAIRAMKNAFDS